MLHVYASENNSSKIRSIILSGEAKVDDEDGNGWTVSFVHQHSKYSYSLLTCWTLAQALHHAAFAGSEALSSLKMLIELQADIDHTNRSGDAPQL